MSNYQVVINTLMKGRLQSSHEAIAKVVQHLGKIVSEEAAKIREEGPPLNEEVVWELVKDRPVFNDEMQNLLTEVDRLHVLYVYSRFLNSKAVGPPLVKAALSEKVGEDLV